MKVLSLFDGISCAYQALITAGIASDTYYTSEVCSYAEKVSALHVDAIRLGDVRNITASLVNDIDLLIAGFPCTQLSISNTQDRSGLQGKDSSLFWEAIRIHKEVNPRWFIYENVASMKESERDVITQALGVEPVMLDASLVSAQQRKRYFWTNIPVALLEDKGITLSDVLQAPAEVDLKYFVSQQAVETYIRRKGKAKKVCVEKSTSIGACSYKGYQGDGCPVVSTPIRLGDIGSTAQAQRVYSTEGKSVNLVAGGGGQGAKTGLYQVDREDGTYGVRRLTPIECERLMGLPDGYTGGISDTRRYQCLGNAFHVDVVAHILKGLK
jgi:DNA (cytosine-5)-methyltransferase 3A